MSDINKVGGERIESTTTGIVATDDGRGFGRAKFFVSLATRRNPVPGATTDSRSAANLASVVES
jgi:hypothetical protein